MTLPTAELERIVRVLRAGGLVACPTETFVGLLADATNQAAVERVCELKGRPAGSPIALLLPDIAALSLVAAEVSASALSLAQRHWPGPLTLVVRARAGLLPALQLDGKVGVRVPGASPALEVVRAFGGPLTATSANRSGEQPARSGAEARARFGSELDVVVEGDSPAGLASTVVDVTADEPKVLRQGVVEVVLESRPA